MIHTNHSFMNSPGMRRKFRWIKNTVCYKIRNLIYRCMTRKLECLLKLYNRELCSTIDRYQNGENAYIYSKQPQQQKQDAALKNIASACLLTVCACKLDDRAPMTDAILTVHGSSKGSSWAIKCRASVCRPPLAGRGLGMAFLQERVHRTFSSGPLTRPSILHN